MFPLVEDMSEIDMPIFCQEYMLFFCLPLSIQPRLNTQQQGRTVGVGATPGRAPLLLCVEPWLNSQWQTEKKHILLAEDGHNFFHQIPESIFHPYPLVGFLNDLTILVTLPHVPVIWGVVKIAKLGYREGG